MPLTWPDPPENIKGAFENNTKGTPLPAAVMLGHLQASITAQRSCFVVYGKHREPLEKLLSNTVIT